MNKYSSAANAGSYLVVNSSSSNLLEMEYLTEWDLKRGKVHAQYRGLTWSTRIWRSHWRLRDEVANAKEMQEVRKLDTSYPFFLSSLILLFCQSLNKCQGVIGKNLQWLLFLSRLFFLLLIFSFSSLCSSEMLGLAATEVLGWKCRVLISSLALGLMLPFSHDFPLN